MVEHNHISLPVKDCCLRTDAAWLDCPHVRLRWRSNKDLDAEFGFSCSLKIPVSRWERWQSGITDNGKWSHKNNYIAIWTMASSQNSNFEQLKFNLMGLFSLTIFYWAHQKIYILHLDLVHLNLPGCHRNRGSRILLSYHHARDLAYPCTGCWFAWLNQMQSLPCLEAFKNTARKYHSNLLVIMGSSIKIF